MIKIATTCRISMDPLKKARWQVLFDVFKDVCNNCDFILVPILTENAIDEISNMCDGLLLQGSFNDTDPKYYNEKALENKSYEFDEYEFDSKVIAKFVEMGKPILGICGGHQELNVYFGGTLNQYIDGHCLFDSNHLADIKNNTFLHSVYNADEIEINSYHHQCVKDLANGFTVSAISKDGIIEGIERDNIIGVQWHPEKLKDYNFFNCFIDKFIKNKG